MTLGSMSTNVRTNMDHWRLMVAGPRLSGLWHWKQACVRLWTLAIATLIVVAAAFWSFGDSYALEVPVEGYCVFDLGQSSREIVVHESDLPPDVPCVPETKVNAGVTVPLALLSVVVCLVGYCVLRRPDPDQIFDPKTDTRYVDVRFALRSTWPGAIRIEKAEVCGMTRDQIRAELIQRLSAQLATDILPFKEDVNALAGFSMRPMNLRTRLHFWRADLMMLIFGEGRSWWDTEGSESDGKSQHVATDVKPTETD